MQFCDKNHENDYKSNKDYKSNGPGILQYYFVRIKSRSLEAEKLGIY